MGIHCIEKKHLSAKGMLQQVRSLFEKVPEPPRDARGLKSDISLPDCLMSGLALFGLKFPSFGSTKNDCEQNATKRFLEHLRREHPNLKLIITSDALSSKAPNIRQIKNMGAHFIIGVKPDGNPSLFEWLKGVECQAVAIKNKKETLELKFVNNIPLNDSNPDLEVNFIECLVKDSQGKIRGRFTWVTDIEVTKNNVHELARGGRARWKIENETFNTLKNQGYHFEHNFGHGYKHLSHVFGLLMFLAFLIDQAQQRCCGLFQSALKKAITKIRLWDKIRSLFTTFYIDSWADAYTWIAEGRSAKLTLDTS